MEQQAGHGGDGEIDEGRDQLEVEGQAGGACTGLRLAQQFDRAEADPGTAVCGNTARLVEDEVMAILEHDPGRDQPGEQILRTGLAARARSSEYSADGVSREMIATPTDTVA